MLHRQYCDNVFFRRNQRLSMFSRGSSRCIVADKLRAMCIVCRAPSIQYSPNRHGSSDHLSLDIFAF